MRAPNTQTRPLPTPPLKSWLCSQVDMPPVQLKDQEPQASVESGEEHQQKENPEEEASAAAAR